MTMTIQYLKWRTIASLVPTLEVMDRICLCSIRTWAKKKSSHKVKDTIEIKRSNRRTSSFLTVVKETWTNRWVRETQRK